MFRMLQEPKEGKTLTLIVDGESVVAREGETVAGVLLRISPIFTRITPVGGALRAPYCMMGVCFECLAVVDGTYSIQTCLTTVRDGMRVERQNGRREVCVNADASGLSFEESHDVMFLKIDRGIAE
jgi:predicted molibdopterin-dependent oxidoreductase YjgC